MKQTKELKDLIWEKTSSEPAFQEIDDTYKEIIRPYVEAIPEVLADMLNETATLVNILKARSLCLNYLASSDFYDKLVPPIEQGSEKTRQERISSLRIETKLDCLYNDLNIMFLSALDCDTGDNFDRTSISNLNKENKRLHRKGKLTIKDLIKTQPEFITHTGNISFRT